MPIIQVVRVVSIIHFVCLAQFGDPNQSISKNMIACESICFIGRDLLEVAAVCLQSEHEAATFPFCQR